jgi:hypothetical protein
MSLLRVEWLCTRCGVVDPFACHPPQGAGIDGVKMIPSHFLIELSLPFWYRSSNIYALGGHTDV